MRKRGAIIRRPGQFLVRLGPLSSVLLFSFFLQVRDRTVTVAMSIKTKCVWIILGLLHPATGHNYYVTCKTPLSLSGHRGFQYQTVPGSGQVRLRRNQEVLECGSELTTGESLGIDVRNTIAGGLYDDCIEKKIGFILIFQEHSDI